MRRLMTFAAVILAMALLAPISPAQVSNSPQVKSPEPGRSLGHAGVMPNPIGVSPVPARAFPTPTPIGVPPTLSSANGNHFGSGSGFHHRHHRHNNFFGGAYPVYVPVPVVVDPYSMYQAAPEQMDQEQDDQAVVPGPTVFERRTPSQAADAPENAEPAPDAAEPASPPGDASPAPSQPAQPQEPSVLVFRDGHQLEVQNYAIVADTLYDFSPGHPRKVPLSQLDLRATVKANDDRGVDFTLPAALKGEE
ncbi:MAG: hypothetical protein ACM3PW_16760 [Chlamydiota bacterium]